MTNTNPVRQYIGARYVPLFADPAEWDNTKTYEPLTIVLHKGNSYTSRQYVPTGIDINNNEYWALTGNYNAQVEAYRKEAQNALNKATTNETNINNIDANLNALHANTITDAQNLYDTIIGKAWNNLVSLGVDNTGNTDVAPIINNIIKESNINGIVFAPGVYRIDSAINIPYNTTTPYAIFIFPGATIKANTQGIDVFTIGQSQKNGTCEGFRIFGGGTIDGNWNATNGIHALTNTRKTTIANITINNCVTNAIYFERTQPVDTQINNIKINGDVYTSDNTHRTENGINIAGTDWLLTDLYASSCKNFIISNGGAQISNIHLFNSKDIAADSTGIKINAGFNQLSNIYVDTIQTAIDSRTSTQPQHITGLQHYFYSAINAPIIGINANSASQYSIIGYDWTYRENNEITTTPFKIGAGGTNVTSDSSFFAAIKETGDFNYTGHTFETRAGGSAICISEALNLNTAGDGILIGYMTPHENINKTATFYGTLYSNAAYTYPQLIRFILTATGEFRGGVIGAMPTSGTTVTMLNHLTLNGTTPVHVGIGAKQEDNKYPVYLYSEQYPINSITKLWFQPAPGDRNGMSFIHAKHKTTALTDAMMFKTSKNL